MSCDLSVSKEIQICIPRYSLSSDIENLARNKYTVHSAFQTAFGEILSTLFYFFIFLFLKNVFVLSVHRSYRSQTYLSV